MASRKQSDATTAWLHNSHLQPPCQSNPRFFIQFGGIISNYVLAAMANHRKSFFFFFCFVEFDSGKGRRVENVAVGRDVIGQANRNRTETEPKPKSDRKLASHPQAMIEPSTGANWSRYDWSATIGRKWRHGKQPLAPPRKWAPISNAWFNRDTIYQSLISNRRDKLYRRLSILMNMQISYGSE